MHELIAAWLIATGHTPAQAETLAAHVPAWRTAPAATVDTFAKANVNLWAEIAGNSPDIWTAHLHSAANSWHNHRLS